jgi:hypothetical protein
MALIQPPRGAPPEQLGEGTQASFQPSLKNVDNGSGRQEFGSGSPKIDSVIVSKIPISTRAAVGAAPGPGLYPGLGNGRESGHLHGRVYSVEDLRDTRGWRSGRR